MNYTVRFLHPLADFVLLRRLARVGAVAKDKRAVDLRNVLGPGKLHDRLELIAKNLDSSRDPKLTADGHAVDHRAAEHHSLRTESEGLENIAAALDPAVDVNLCVCVCV